MALLLLWHRSLAQNHNGEKPTRPCKCGGIDLSEIISGLKTSQFSSQDLTRAYLQRIETIDRSGPTLNAVISLNSSAMKLAKKSDMRRTQGRAKSPLDGVPFLLKDNIESKGLMATTAGSTALIDNVTGRDSPLVARLRDSGAIILGKANLSQWANFRSSHSVSGWSTVGGLVKIRICRSTSLRFKFRFCRRTQRSCRRHRRDSSIICPSQVNGCRVEAHT